MAELTNVQPTLNWPELDALDGTDVALALSLLQAPDSLLAYIVDLMATENPIPDLLPRIVDAPAGSAPIQKGIATFSGTLGNGEYNPGIALGAPLPLVEVGETEPVMITALEQGAQAWVRWQNVRASKRSPIDLGLIQMTNKYILTNVPFCLGAISAAIPSTGGSARVITAADSALSATLVSTIYGPLTAAAATIEDALQGLKGTTVLMSAWNASQLYANGPTALIQAFEGDRNGVAYRGKFGSIGEFDILTVPTPFCVGTPLETMALVYDKQLMGGRVERYPMRISTVYHGAEWRDGTRETFILSLEHAFAPFVQFESAGVWIDGLFV